ncbi:ankyrin repeat-containing domain protein [Geopyxis carbonaria]|nr:ankyrin repeat-containing domain protein [Geopyxis carbonaria]
MAIFSDLPCDILIEIGDWLTYEDKEERDEVPHINSKLFADYAALLRVSRKCYEDLAYWFYHKISIQAIPRRGCTYIHYMAASGCDIAIRRLLGFNPKLLHQIGERDLKGKVPSDYMRPIHYAAEGGHLSTYKLLESEGDDPGALPSSKTEPSKEKQWIDALELAVLTGQFTIVETLLNCPGIIPDDTVGSPLHIAVMFQCLWMVELLLEYGADINLRAPPSAGWGPTETPLDLAMIQGDDAIVQVMMQRAVDDSNSMDWEEDNPYDEERKPDSNPEGEESGDKDGEWVDPTTGEPAEHLDNVNYLDNLLDLEL